MGKDIQKQTDKIKGDYVAIAHITGATSKYVEMVLEGKRPSNTPKAETIREAARLYWLFREILHKRFHQQAS